MRAGCMAAIWSLQPRDVPGAACEMVESVKFHAAKHELNIMTNDGWVVTLLSDKPIDLGDTVLTSIIVQPKADHDARVPVGSDPDVTRTEYRLRRE